MPNESQYLEVVLPDPSQTGKALRASEGMQQMSQAIAKVLEIDVTGLTMPYTVPYSPSEGGDKTALQFMVLRLIGTQAASYSIELPARDHFFVVDNWSDRSATIFVTGGTGTAIEAGENALVYADADGVNIIRQFTPIEHMMFALTSEVGAVSVASGIIKFRMPYGFMLSKVKASLSTAQTSGSKLTLDVLKNGVSIFSTLLTFDNTEKTTETASVGAVMSTPYLDDDAEIAIDCTQVGSGDGAGLKVTFVGARS